MRICTKCVLPETYPDIQFDQDGVCNYCHSFEKRAKAARERDFETQEEVIQCLQKYRNPKEKYDVLLALSGGVDSSNALITIVEEYKLRPLVFHNDHGYEDDIASQNAQKLCAQLGVDLITFQQDLNFMKKLWKTINESEDKIISSCYACGNMLYLNGLELAQRFNIKLVINGYSKGQIEQVNETAGAANLERMIEIVMNTGDKEFCDEFIRKYKVLEKRTAYHAREDLEREVDPDKILFVPFYIFNFNRIDKEALKKKLQDMCDWQPMKVGWPKRTTNCEMIWLNTYMDKKRLGYSNYDFEYAEFVRNGEIPRDKALVDLEFDPPEGLVERLAEEVGVDLKKFDNRPTGAGKGDQGPDQAIDFDF